MDVSNRVIGFSGYFDVVVYGGIDIDLDVISGECFLPIEVDDVGLHIDDVDLVGERVEVLQPRAHSLDVSSESFIDA